MAATLTGLAVAADAAGLPASDARHAILTAAWVAVAAELLHSVAACLVVGNNVCNLLCCVEDLPGEGRGDCCARCCAGCCRSRRRRHRRGGHHQPLLLNSPAAAAAAAAATSAVLNQSWWWQRRQQQPGGIVVQQPGGQPVTVVTVQHGAPRAGGYMVSLWCVVCLRRLCSSSIGWCEMRHSYSVHAAALLV